MLLKAGNNNASVLVLCEDPKEDHFIKNTPILRQDLELFAAACKSNKFRREDFMFLSCSDVVPVEFAGTDAKKRKYASKFSEEISTVVNGSKFSCVITLGKVAASLLMKHEIKITQARGKREMIPDSKIPVYYMLSPSYVRMYPEHQELFFHDFYYLGKFRDAGYDITKELVENKATYEWCEDLTPFMKDIKSAEMLAMDTETTGLDWFKDDVVPLTVQMSFKEGHALVCPVHEIYFKDSNKDKLANLRLQIKEIVEDRNIKKVGHNLKYDYLILRKNGLGKMKGWAEDTLVMAFFADENMKDKSLDECARRWIPAMAGYNDWFKYDKSKMIEVPKEDLIIYGGGDTDATLRLHNVLKEVIIQDKKHYNCYTNLSFPAFRNFGVFVEPNGQKIDFCAMAELKKNFEDEMEKIYKKLIVMIPEKVKKEHTDKGKALSFSRPDFIRDVLFTKSGFGLKPVLATKSTKKLGKKDQIPSTDMKKHLSYFTDHPFVNDYIQYRKMSTIKTGFMNNFHKYVDKENRIHPTYTNARVVTGRTACLAGDTEILVYNDEGIVTHKSIKDIVAGDKVVCYDKYGVVSSDNVVWAGETKISDVIKVRLVHRFTSTEKFITCTADHRFMMFNGDYVEAVNIKPNWIFRSYPIREAYKFGGYKVMERQIPVYDIETEKHHNFIANGVCVHNSNRPNGQNMPKRGKLAKLYRKIFVPSPGYCFIEADFSQAELRVAAVMANDPVMMKAYRDGRDIHKVTGAEVNGYTLKKFELLADDIKKRIRQQAKAINFGLCIQKGLLTLTDRGLVPIESVTKQDKLWDGVEWVNHDGVQYMGYKEVIEYQGLSATPDHVVFTHSGEMTLQEAKNASENLVVTEIEGKEIRIVDDYRRRSCKEGKAQLCALQVRYNRSRKSCMCSKFNKWKVKRLKTGIYEKAYNIPTFQSFRGKIRFNKTTMPDTNLPMLRKLRRAGDTIKVQLQKRIYSLDGRKSSSQRLQGCGYRENRQRGTLRTRKPTTGIQIKQFIKSQNKQIYRIQRYKSLFRTFMAFAENRLPYIFLQSTVGYKFTRQGSYTGTDSVQGAERKRFAQVYDIKNCGQRHRFTVSGVLVHNCYGMGAKGLQTYAKTEYGVEMSLDEAELFRNKYFSLYSGLLPWHKHQINFCKKHGYVRGLLGAKHTIPSIYSNDDYVRSTAERYAINYPVQRCASDMGLFAKSRVCADIDPRLGKCVGFVHDALIFEARIDDRMEVAAAVKWYMENQPLKQVFDFEFPIPIVADVSIGMENLSDMEEVSIEAVKPDWHKERFLKLQGFKL